jgi:arginase
VPKGFDRMKLAIINQIIETKKVVCIEFVEVNPCWIPKVIRWQKLL